MARPGEGGGKFGGGGYGGGFGRGGGRDDRGEGEGFEAPAETGEE